MVLESPVTNSPPPPSFRLLDSGSAPCLGSRINLHPSLDKGLMTAGDQSVGLRGQPIEEKVGSTLERIGTGDHFLNITPTAQTLSATINQWDYMKLRSFCKAKDTVTKTKHQPTEWEKIFTNPTSDRGLISRIYKELKKHDIKTPNSPIEKMGYRTKQRIYSRRISNGGKTLKEMLNILTHQRNANQNNSKIPSYTCQNG
ncbi:hypothetical protein STEG23_001505 [Scotinomys teguina]